MYFKLSLRNARRQAQDYLVYFVTIVMVVALIYAFNGLIFSKEVQNLSERMAEMPVAIVLTSIVVIGIVGWLVLYTTNFMLERRSREFGIYILTGLENKQAARLFFLENLVVGGCAFGAGIIFGNLLYQILRAIVLALFKRTYTFTFFFSFRAVALTFLYFVLIYLFAQWKGRRQIRGMKIYDLIYYDRQNEGMVIQTSKNRRKVFYLSVVLGVLGTVMIMLEDFLFGVIGAGCIIIFLYGFFLSFASGVPAYFDKHAAVKYRGQNVLIFRALTAKLGSMGVVMATVALLFTATLISEGTGRIFGAIFQERLKQTACFDLFVSSEEYEMKETLAFKYIQENIPVASEREYQIYLNRTGEITDYLEENIEYFRYYDHDTLMRASDYAALRAMLGYPAVAVKEGQYLIHCQSYVADVVKAWKQPINVAGYRLTPGGIYTEHFGQYFMNVNGAGFILVVPDELAEACEVSHHIYAAMTKVPVSEVQSMELEEKLGRIKTGSGSWGSAQSVGDWVVYVKSQEEAGAAFMTMITIFPLYYLALVLTMAAATVLTIQQLCETERYRRQFGLLQKLGMDKREMEGTLRGQLLIYYAMPAIPPLLISVPFILNLANATEPGTMVGGNGPLAIIGLVLGLFFLVYGLYILLAYTNLKNNVL